MRTPIVKTAIFLACALASRSALAQEHEHHLGLGGGMSVLDIADKSTASVGGGLALHYSYSVNDMFSVMAEGSYSIVALKQSQDSPDTPHTRPATVTTFGAGAGYLLDVMRFVPYVGVLATGAVLGGGTIDNGSELLLGGALAAGLDYRFTNFFAAGVAYRQYAFLTQMSTYPSYSTFLLRAEYILKL